MKIQVANGGYVLGGSFKLNDGPNDYIEPGFTVLFPLQYQVVPADTLFFLIRRRTNNTGTTFSPTLSPSSYTVMVTEESTGQQVNATLTNNSITPNWNSFSPVFSPLVIQIPVEFSSPNNAFRDRLLKVSVIENGTQECLVFRVLVGDYSRPFSTITTYRGNENQRQTKSVLSSSLTLTATQKGCYTILTPLNTLAEVSDVSVANFSYPQDRIYYTRDASVNLEDYEFSIQNPSHPCIPQVVTIDSIPGYPGVAVLNVTGYARKSLALLTGQPSFQVYAQSISGLNTNIDILNVYLNRKFSMCAFDE